MTDRCTVFEFVARECLPLRSSAMRTLEWFAAGVLSQQCEAPRAPTRFRPFEWRRQLGHALSAARAQGIAVPGLS